MRQLFGLPPFSLRPPNAAALLLSVLAATLSGCQLFEPRAAQSVVPDTGVVRLQGIAQSGHIAKNAAGMPLIESGNLHDLLFTLGYSQASDRLTQMVQLRLLAQGRLAELYGAEMLDLDRLMRAINLSADGQNLYKNTPKNLQSYLAIYARGVNAYLYQMRNTLPPELAQANFKPEYWQAEDSALLLSLFSFSQSGNLAEEILALALAQHLDTEQLPWLLPVYPDEALAVADAQKIPAQVLRNSALSNSTLQLLDTLNQFSALNTLQAPLATSWVSSPQQNLTGASSLTLHSLQAQPQHKPAPYSWVNLHSPQLQAAGLSIAGVPVLIAGFNGQLAYSISAVMADSQDVFIEQLRQQQGRLEYLANDQWQPAQQRMETFFIRGQRPVREAIYSTAHGPLLTTLAPNSSSGYGLALQRTQQDADRSFNVLWQLLSSASVEKASELVQELRALPANVLLADAKHIAWQVTGSYPNRRNSRGLFPAPGWDATVAWEGYADPMLYPYDQDPAQGWLSAANQRLTQPGYGLQLSSSWANPERAENLAIQLTKKPNPASLALPNDTSRQRPWLITQLQQMLSSGGMPTALQQALQKLPSAQRSQAQQALQGFLALPADQPLSAQQVAQLQSFLAQAQAQLFSTELQSLPTSVQQAFSLHSQHSYPAWLDHLLGRDDSPFWQHACGSKAQFLLNSFLHSSQASSQAATPQPSYSQSLLVDFSQAVPVSAASFSGQSDNPYSPYQQLPKAVTGKLYPLPNTHTDIEKVYGKQRLTLLPGK